jgi:hypothetical protein
VDIPFKSLRWMPTELLAEGVTIKHTADGVKFEMQGISHAIFKK